MSARGEGPVSGGPRPSQAAGAGDLRRRVEAYLRGHHTATIATVGPAGTGDAGMPHAATVFYAVDHRLRLVFLSKGTSRHGLHIAPGGAAAAATGRSTGGATGAWVARPAASTSSEATATSRTADGTPVAVTVAGLYDDWREIQGLQIWGTAELLRGVPRAGAMATYLRRFPFVAGLLKDPRLAKQVTEIQVFRVTPERVALTDNSTGLFGREILEVGDAPGRAPTGGRLQGIVVSGRREAAGFIDVPWVKEQLTRHLGVEPYSGTLNLELRDPAALASWRLLAAEGDCLEVSPAQEGFCSGAFYPVVVGGVAPAGIVLPRVPGYPEDVIELVAGERLRDSLDLDDGDEVVVEWE